MADETFRKRQGTTDEGKDYENCVVAYYVLKLTSDSTVKNFKLTSNDESFGDFDDVVVEVEKEECTERYALQLKHVSNKKKLSLASLREEKGNLSITKYFRSFQTLSKSFPDYKLILSTNKAFTLNDDEDVDFQLNVLSDVFHVRIVKCKAVTLLNTSDKKSDECFQFRIVGNENPLSTERQEYEQFFDSFFLYANQANVEALKRDIPRQIKKQFSCDDAVSNKHLDLVASEYIKYISEWSKRDGVKEKLNKPLMLQVITLYLLNTFILSISFNSVVSTNGKLLQEAISKFDITIFDKELDISVRRIWSDAKDQLGDILELNKLSKKYQTRRDIDCIESLNDDECTKFLWIMGKCPLIVSESPLTIKAIEFCTNGKFVLLGTNLVTDLLQQYSVFRDINDLKAHLQLYQKLTQEFLCGTPGNEFSLEELIRDDKSIETVITSNELLKMIDGPYAIEHKQETLPLAHISRSLSRHVVDFKYLETVDEGTLLVISNVSNRQIVINSTKSTHDGRNLHLFQNECSQDEFLKICRATVNIQKSHHLKMLDENCLEWLQSQGDISDIDRFLLDGYFLEQECVADLQNSINVISDEPGKGKSVLLKSLKNQFRSKCWVVMFSSAHLADLCAKIRRTEYTDVVDAFKDFLRRKEFSNFTNNFDKRILNFALRKDRIIYLWDALDEISLEDLCVVSNLIKKLPRKNCIHWITCRSHLKNHMQHEFCVFARTIAQFSEEEQRLYLEKRLRGIFSDTDFDDAIRKIKTYLTFTTSDFFLGVLIQICMLAELFITDPEKYSSLMKTQFLVTDLYSHSIEQKIKLFYKSESAIINYSHFGDCKKYRLRNYAEAALISLFRKDFITSLNLRCEDFLEDIEQEGDVFGIITEINGDDKMPHFVHSSYAEYFAATYFVKYYRTIPTLKDILFDVKYTNIRFLFDIILAQDSAAHIAILHKNLEDLKHCENLTCRDSGGRSALHLACSWGERYPVLKCYSEGGINILEDEDTYLVKQESVDYTKMLEHLLEKLDPLEKDNTYNMNSLCYAKKSESLLTIAFIEKKQKINCLVNEEQNIICSILYYSVMFGDDDVISMHSCIKVIKIKSDDSLLHLAVKSKHSKCLLKLLSMDNYCKRINDINMQGYTALSLACRDGKKDMVKILLNFGANKLIPKFTPLHAACYYGHMNIVQYLIKIRKNESHRIPSLDEEIDGADQKGRTPLMIACGAGKYAMADLLITSGANVNAVDEKGSAPLLCACSSGYDKVANLLINSGAKVNVTNKYSRTPLMTACSAGLDKVANLLISLGAKINVVDEDGWTPLMCACSAGHDTVANLLITSGGDVNAVDEESWTPLTIACSKGHYTVANLLINSGGNVNAIDKSGWTPLMSACSAGHDRVANLLITSGANVNAVDVEDCTPLMVACSTGYEIVVKLLINLGANVNAVSEKGWTPLMDACFAGHDTVANLLINSGAAVNAVDEEGLTPLTIACSKGYYTVANLLINSGGNVNAIDKSGWTPLMSACSAGHDRVANLLITSGANVNAVDVEDCTPLMFACSTGYETVVKLLINLGANVNAVSENGWTPLMCACSAEHNTVANLLITSGANVNAVSEKGWTLLMCACSAGHDTVANLLITSGADVNAVDEKNWTPLMLACSKGHYTAANLLINSGGNVNAIAKSGWTPLMSACSTGHDRVANLLITSGANVNAVDEEGCTPLMCVCSTGSETVAKLLINSGANVSAVTEKGWAPLMEACFAGHDTVANLLINSGADVNAVDEEGLTPLTIACSKGHYTVVNLLINSGGNVNAIDKNGWTPLMSACSTGHDTVANLLINSGADVNAVDEKGCTPLMGVCRTGCETVVKLLINSGANVNAVREKGWTPLMDACFAGHDTVANLLINSGADVNAIDEKGCTPLMGVCRTGCETVAKLLINSGARVNAVDIYSWTPLIIACSARYYTLVNLLINSGADTNIKDIDSATALYISSINGYLKIVDLLIKSGSEIDARDKDGTTSLIEACYRGFYDVAEMLINCGADINIVDKDGLTSLGAAFHNKHSNIVKLLIDHGADLNHMGAMYTTPLYAHCEHGYLKNVQYCIEMGTDVNAVVYNGWRSIHIACYKGYEDIVRALLEAGADTNAQTSRGDSPIDLALENGHAQIVSLLKKYIQKPRT